MHRNLPHALLAALLPALLAAGTGTALAQGYPNRPIRLLVAYAPGGATDISARVLAPRMGESLGQQVIVDNRPGANGLIATGVLAKATPDGHTLMLVDSAHGANPALTEKMPYDTLKDIASLGMVSRIPMMLVVNPQFPAKTVRDLVAMAKAQPGRISYASAGSGSAIFLATELFRAATGIDIVQIAYKGGGPAMTDVIGGQVPMMFITVAASMAHVKAGRLLAIGISSPKPAPSFPEIPAIAEAGVPGFEFHLWQALIAPAGLPRATVARLNKDLVAALGQPEVRERLQGLGAEVVTSTPEQSDAHIRAEVERWKKTLKPGM